MGKVKSSIVTAECQWGERVSVARPGKSNGEKQI